MKLLKLIKSKECIFGTKFLVIANIVAFIAVVIVNYLATNLPIWGLTTGELSDLYPNLFVPAGLTFSIWWIIYLFLLWFVIWQAIDFYKKKSLWITKKISRWFILSCLANIWWILAWHNQKVLLSVIIMILFLLILIIINQKVKIGKKIWNIRDKIFLQIPFSIYLWWISVATIANISAWLVNIWWSSRWISPIIWTIIMIVIASLLAIMSLYKKNDIVFSSVIVWAILGIIIKRLGAEIVYSQIIRVAAICIVLISFVMWYNYKKWLKN